MCRRTHLLGLERNLYIVMLGDAKDGIDYFMDRNAAVAAARRRIASDGQPRSVATWPGAKTVWTPATVPPVETTDVFPQDAEV